MARHATTLIRWLMHSAETSASALSLRAALLATAVGFVVFLWVVTVAPPFLSFALTIALAIAWCVWLEQHPEPGGAGDAPPHAMGELPPSNPAVHVLASTADGAKSALETARRRTQASVRPGVSAQDNEERIVMVSQNRVLQSEPGARHTRRSTAQASVLALVVCLLAPLSAAGQSTGSTAQSEPPTPEQQPATSSSQISEDPWRNIKFGATLEGYYQYNWNRPPDRSLVLRAYDTRANTFGIQQAALVFDAAPDVDASRRYGLRVDLQFGQATETVQGGSANEPRPNVYRHVWQAYGTYVFPVGADGLQADFGKFASMLGYETNYAKDNQAFSRAYLFNFLPFYHSGLRLTLPVSNKVSLLYMLTNGIQQTEEFNDFKSSHVAAIVKPAPRVTWTVNYYFGQEQADNGEPGGPDGFFRVFDSYVTVTPTSALAFGVDANYVTNEVNSSEPSLSLQGIGTYARYQVTNASAIGVRYERLDDEGLFGGIAQVLHEATFTAEYKLADGFIVRAEFRRDWSSESFFPGRLGAEDLRGHQNTALIGGIWVIGNKTGTW